MNAYEKRCFSSDKAIHLAANDDLPSLRKKLRRDYAQFLIDYYELQEDPVQQRILESTKMFKNQHDMNQANSIRQAIKLRKDLFMDVWPNHNTETEKASEDQEDSTTSWRRMRREQEWGGGGWPIGWLDNWPIRRDLSLYKVLCSNLVISILTVKQ